MQIGKYSTGLGEICTIIRLAVEEDLDKVVRNCILFIMWGTVGIQRAVWKGHLSAGRTWMVYKRVWVEAGGGMGLRKFWGLLASVWKSSIPFGAPGLVCLQLLSTWRSFPFGWPRVLLGLVDLKCLSRVLWHFSGVLVLLSCSVAFN